MAWKTLKTIVILGLLAFSLGVPAVWAQSCCVDGGATITSFAGNGSFGYSGDGGPATQASLFPVSGCADALGNTYLVDPANNVVRKVSASGIITTFAGSVTYGFSGDGGPATLAELELGLVSSVGADAAGNVYILDTGNNRVRVVNASGAITTAVVFPSLSPGLPQDMALDTSGNFIVCFFPYSGTSGNWILKVTPLGAAVTLAGNGTGGYSGDNGPAASAMISVPDAVTTDSSGNIYFDDSGNFRIRKIDTSGNISTYAGNGSFGHGGDGGPATQATIDDAPGLAYCSGTLFLADIYGYLRMVSPSGVITTFAGNGVETDSGDGGPASSSSLNFPGGLWLDSQKSLYTAENQGFFLNLTTGPVTLLVGNRVRKILNPCIPTVTPTPTLSPTPSPTPLPCPPGYTGPQPPGPGESFTYPAPASAEGGVNFVYDMREAGTAQVLVWNERGDLAAQISQNQGCGVQESALNLQRFAAGVYFYRIRLKYGPGGEDDLPTQKFMVRK